MNSSVGMPDRMASASLPPTPLILISVRNSVRSASDINPNNCWASSRTARWVYSVTGSPTDGRSKIVDIGASTS